jgi:hypothetical protein
VSSLPSPVLRAARIDDDAIDGPDPVEWSRATPVTWDTDFAGAPTGIVTRVSMLYSSGALYVRCELESAGLNVDRARPTDRPRPQLYEEDCVEIFVAPDARRPRRYFEMEWGPCGHYWELAIDLDEARSDDTWSSGTLLRTSADAGRRTATIEATVTAPAIVRALVPGEALAIGLYRMEGAAPRRYLAWSPPRTERPNFHVPEAFGTLVLE